MATRLTLTRFITFAAALAPGGAWAANAPATALSLIPHIVTAGTIGLAVAAILFSIGFQQRARAREDAMRTRLNAALREAQAGALALTGEATEIFRFAADATAGDLPPDLERLLDGPDGGLVRMGVEALRRDGEPFTQIFTTASGQRYRASGRVFGREAILAITAHNAESMQAPAPAAPTPVGDAALIEALALPLAVRDAEGRLTFANAAYAAMAGARSGADAVLTQTSLHPVELQAARAAVAAQSSLREKRYVVIGGQRRAVNLTVSPDGTGRAIVTAVDATDLDDAEARLQRHIDAHDETLNKLKTAVAIFGPDKRLAFHNRAYADLWRLDQRWLEEKPGEGEILERLREHRRLPEQRDFPAWKRTRLDLYAKVIEPVEELWHLPDNRTLRVVIQAHPFGGLLYLFEDVTDQLTLESNYNTLIGVQRSTLDQLHEGVALFGTDGRLKLYNASFARLWRLDAASLEGEPRADRVAELCRPLAGSNLAWGALVEQATGAGERHFAEGDLERLDGSTLRYGAVPLPDGATLLSFIDITDSVRAEERLIERNEALQQADNLKSSFLAQVSYLLRTPLQTIQGFSETLSQGYLGELTPKQSDYVLGILAASNDLKGQIDNMVDLAAIDAGTMTLDRQDVELARFLPQMRSLVQDRCDKAGLELIVDCGDDVGVISADPTRLKQVLFNLLSNAIAHTPGGGTISFGAAGEGASVRVWVRDTGPGIAPENQPSAFDRFESRKVDQGRRGAGLGLALVKSIVELHGGWVALKSRPGEGTEVTCHFLRVAPAVAATDEDKAAE